MLPGAGGELDAVGWGGLDAVGEAGGLVAQGRGSSHSGFVSPHPSFHARVGFLVASEVPTLP